MTAVPPPASYDAEPEETELDLTQPVAGVAISGSAGRLRSRSTGDAVAEWVERHARTLGGALVVGAVAVAGVFAWRASERTTAVRADRALYEAEARYIQGDPAAVQALRQVTTRYGSTPAGAHARVLLAQANYDQAKYADGLKVVEGGSPPAYWQEPIGRMRAVGQEGVARPRDAAATYERLAQAAGPDARSSLLADAARAYEAAGDVAGARRTWQAIVDAARPGTADEARIRLGELSARAR